MGPGFKGIEIAENIYWVGNSEKYGNLRTNPYLIIEDGGNILVDPGSVLSFDDVRRNIAELSSLEDIKFVIIHNPDAGSCSSLPLFEKAGLKAEIICHWQTSLSIQFYGIKSDFYHINLNGFALDLPSGRKLDFIHTPYLNSPGSFITFDNKTRTLFSGLLFGSFSLTDSLFADEYYLEQMKSFHESTVASKEIITPVLEKILWTGVKVIAPSCGSIISNDPELYVMELMRISAGEMLRPIRKEIMEAGGLSNICSKVLKHLASVFPVNEVLEVFRGSEIQIDEATMAIEGNDLSGSRLWEMIFEIIYEKKGVHWLSEVQPLALELADGFSLNIPEVFARQLTRYEEKMRKMDRENLNLKELNEELLSTMEMTLERLTKDPVTRLFNEGFFRDFLQQEVNNSLENNDDFTIFTISLDQASQILFNSGPELLNEVTTQLVFLLQNMKKEGKMLFKLDGTDLALFLPRTKISESLELAEQIRNSVASSGLFVMPVTISAGVISLGEFQSTSLPKESLASFIISTGKSRLNIARSTGANIICSSSELSSDTEERKKILIIDSDEMNLEILNRAFEQLEIRTISCSDGDEACRLLETEQPSLVISEVMVPKADGFMIRERMLLSSTLANIPMILLSNFKDEKNVQRALSLNVMYYLKKPYMLSELTGIARNILRTVRI